MRLLAQREAARARQARAIRLDRRDQRCHALSKGSNAGKAARIQRDQNLTDAGRVTARLEEGTCFESEARGCL